MASIRTAPSSWPLIEDLACSALEDLEEPLQEALIETATSLLWNWTGRVFGLEDITARPCRRDCGSSTYQGIAGVPSNLGPNMPFLPVLINGEFFNLSCGRSCSNCSCSQVQEIGLAGPVDSIIEVIVDGEILPSSAYRLENRRWLVRQDGERWPTCQDLKQPAGEPGTWSVAYRWGTPVPKGGQVAASILSCEMAKAALGRDCELPQRVQSVTREGVSVAILDSFEGLEAGRTGIWLVDSWVTSVTKAPRRSRVLSPDSGPARVQT
jgi:hypothetical protein